ncbi:sialin-like isoform X1 [Clavelina lepadiformis]|uniref:sialin-like isoform X1 n=1 Tax=Clavelina lepadiformis TaxID=159417 RepID=UPI004042496F
MPAHLKSKRILEEESPGCYIKARYVLALMTALGTLNAYSLRNGINIAIVNMTVSRSPNNLTTTGGCTRQINVTRTDDKLKDADFEWSITEQTLVMGSFYYGYCVTNIPGAWMAKRYGIRIVLGVSSLLCALLTLLVPLVAKSSLALLVALRITLGAFQGVTFPTAWVAWGYWAPPLERSRLVSITLSGLSMGYFVVYPVVGGIVSSFGWEASFYITGAIGIVFAVVWLSIIHDTPAEHPRISRQEKDYIEQSIHGDKIPTKKEAIPWLEMAKSVPAWATIASHLADNYLTFTLGIMAPTYIARVYGLDIKSVGFLAALPFLIRLILNLVGSSIADMILTKRLARIVTVRKLASVLPLTISSISLVILAYLNCNIWPAVALISVSGGILGLTTSGHACSFVDISPSFGGITYSISNTLASVIGFIAPQVAGAFLSDNLVSSWKKVFWLAAAIGAFGAVIFLFFASDRIQSWAKGEETKEGETQEIKVLI